MLATSRTPSAEEATDDHAADGAVLENQCNPEFVERRMPPGDLAAASFVPSVEEHIEEYE